MLDLVPPVVLLLWSGAIITPCADAADYLARAHVVTESWCRPWAAELSKGRYSTVLWLHRSRGATRLVPSSKSTQSSTRDQVQMHYFQRDQITS